MKTWGDLLEHVRRSLARGDLDAAAQGAEWMAREAERSGEPRQLASAAFYRGMVRDAQGRLEDAELAFGEAISWDERAHGPEHPAIADATRSLALVQARAKKIDAAVRSFERASALYAANGAPEASETLTRAGRALASAERHDEALARFERAEAIAIRTSDRVHARNAAAESQRRSKRFLEAFTIAARTTRLGTELAGDDDRLAIANTWLILAFLSRHAFGREEQAVLAYAVARAVATEPEVRRRAAAAIRESPHAGLGERPIEGWVVAWSDPERGVAHVLHPREGLHVVRDRVPLEPGTPVEIARAPDGTVARAVAR